MRFDEWIPDYFENVSQRAADGQQLSFLKQEENILKDFLKDGRELLDIGCATGYSFYNFKNYDINFYGVDIVDSYIEDGKKNLAKVGLKSERLWCQSIYDLDENKKFDITVCNTMIQHLEEYENAFDKIAAITNEVALIRTLTSDKTILRKTPDHDLTKKDWKDHDKDV